MGVNVNGLLVTAIIEVVVVVFWQRDRQDSATIGVVLIKLRTERILLLRNWVPALRSH